MPHVILCCILGNEERIIERLLSSVISSVDGVCLSVNGKDQTEEICQKFLANYSVPYRVVRHEWKNFAHNRSLSIKETKSFAEAQGWKLDECYALTLDADMIFVAKAGFAEEKKKLSAHGYSIYQVNRVSGNRLPNLRFLRLDLNWASYTYTHEYWDDESITVKTSYLNSCWIDDINDGGSKGDKYQRDYALLHLGLKEDLVRRSRYLYYLAQTCQNWGDKCRRQAKQLSSQLAPLEKLQAEIWAKQQTDDVVRLKKEIEEKISEVNKKIENFEILSSQLYREGIQMCQDRIAEGNYRGECWRAHYICAKIHKKMKKYAKAAHWFNLAIDYDPERAEPYYRCAKMYYQLGNYKIAYELAVAGSKVPYPKVNDFMVEWRIYAYRFLFLISMCAFRIPNQRFKGLVSLEEVSLNENLSPEVRGWAIRDKNHFFLSQLSNARNPSVHQLDPELTAPIYLVPIKNGYLASSAGKLLKLDNKFKPMETVIADFPSSRLGKYSEQIMWANDKNWGKIKGKTVSISGPAVAGYPHFVMNGVKGLTGFPNPLAPQVSIVAGPLDFIKDKEKGLLFIGRDEKLDDNKLWASHRFIVCSEDWQILQMSGSFCFLSPGNETCHDLFYDNYGNFCMAISDQNGQLRLLKYGDQFIREQICSFTGFEPRIPEF